MKAILIINTPEDFDYRRCSMGGDGNIYYDREDEQRTSIIGNIKNLKTMPQYKDDLKYLHSYTMGWNDCIDEMLGGE